MNQNVTVHPTVAAFAAGVRHQLSGLDAHDLMSSPMASRLI